MKITDKQRKILEDNFNVDSFVQAEDGIRDA